MKRTIFLSTMLFALIFTGCKKDNNELEHTNNVAQPNSENFQKLRKTALDEVTKVKEFVVDGNGAIEFTSEKGVKVSIPESCLHINGQAVSGTVKVEFIELFEKDKLLTTNIATMGWDTQDKVVKFLVTGGAFFLRLTQNGKEVENYPSCYYQLNVPASLTGGVKQEMGLWYGRFDTNDNLIWEEAVPDMREGEIEGGFPVGDYVDVNNETYFAIVSKFGWVNCDYFYKDPREKTLVKVKLPQGYGYENSGVYMSYKNVPGLNRLWPPNVSEQVFEDYNVPIGLEVSVIFATESNGKWAYAIKTIKVAKNQQVEFLKQELKEATQAEFEKAILEVK